GWNWADGIDVPLGEETERYRVTRIAVGQSDVTEETTAPTWIYPGVSLAGDRAAGLVQTTVRIVQVGARAVSAPTTTSVSLI
ncbi:MAG: hypothetical protein JWL66_2938, partial [Sphingomonadales bacterium]|nr:hypothetical protein [Sphingomonadales bacterium]